MKLDLPCKKSSLGSMLLMLAAVIVGLIALAHIGVILGGASWYRAFGAGEDMAQMAENGSPLPMFVTSLITIILGIWSVYAYSGATGRFSMPFLRTGLLVVASIFILRGFAGLHFYWQITSLERGISRQEIIFISATSLGSFIIGMLYLIGFYLQRGFLEEKISQNKICI